MKKTFKLLFLFTFILVSCSNDDDGVKSSTTLNITEGKQALEDNSIEVLNKIEEYALWKKT